MSDENHNDEIRVIFDGHLNRIQQEIERQKESHRIIEAEIQSL